MIQPETEEVIHMAGTFMALLVLAIEIAVIAVIAYFVIKKAVKDAIRESKEEKRN